MKSSGVTHGDIFFTFLGAVLVSLVITLWLLHRLVTVGHWCVSLPEGGQRCVVMETR